ncbi:MAG: hypothetical protein CMK24_00510 [Porticoccaceae bacterium]|nr:hypothetical protein [Porticoccaceae bacterium]|tara:strand:+ start:3222 stop:3563 length:342 start_codon:yes stop_codon:yes gene_type:complete
MARPLCPAEGLIGYDFLDLKMARKSRKISQRQASKARRKFFKAEALALVAQDDEVIDCNRLGNVFNSSDYDVDLVDTAEVFEPFGLHYDLSDLIDVTEGAFVYVNGECIPALV